MNEKEMMLLINLGVDKRLNFKYISVNNIIHNTNNTVVLKNQMSIDRYNENKIENLISSLSAEISFEINKLTIDNILSGKNRITEKKSNFKDDYSEFLFKLRKANYENKKIYINYEYLHYIKSKITSIDELLYIDKHVISLNTDKFSYLIVGEFNNLFKEPTQLRKTIDHYNFSNVYETRTGLNINEFLDEYEVKEYINLRNDILSPKKTEREKEKIKIVSEIKKTQKINFNF